MRSFVSCHRWVCRIFLSCLILCAVLPILPAGEVHSALWGKDGEAWKPDGRLPDFSHAGYRRGEAPLPKPKVVTSVVQHGAKGDGKTDDTEAFEKAIAAATDGAILIPAGRYVITRILKIEKSNVVLRGEGPDKSVLFFPKPLQEIKPNWSKTTSGRKTSNYSWSGGLVWLQGNFQSDVLAQITEPAKRGVTELAVSKTDGLKPGQSVEVLVKDDDKQTLVKYLYSGDAGDIKKFKKAGASMVVVIKSIANGKITFDRPLRFDVRAVWSPVVRRFEPTVRESGIEHLGFEFASGKYNGHFSERGFNAATFVNVADCWIDNIRILNADSGVFIRAFHYTVQNLVIDSKRPPSRGCTGHHGILLTGSDNLCTRFRFNTRFIHDLGVTSRSIGNVYSSGSGVDLNFDHHRRGPYENLFTDLDAGAGSRIWHCGGGQSLGKHCGARGTFWNIRSKKGLAYPDAKFGPKSMNLVAVNSAQKTVMEPAGKWMEVLNPKELSPQNLHEAQRDKRLKSAGLPAVAGGNATHPKDR